MKAADHLILSEAKLSHRVRAGEVPHTRVGSSLRLTKDSLDRYLEEQTSNTWTPHGHEEE